LSFSEGYVQLFNYSCIIIKSQMMQMLSPFYTLHNSGEKIISQLSGEIKNSSSTCTEVKCIKEKTPLSLENNFCDKNNFRVTIKGHGFFIPGKPAIIYGGSSNLSGKPSGLVGRSSVKDGGASMPDGRSSIVDGRSSDLDGRSSIIDAMSSVLDGRSSIMDGGSTIVVESPTVIVETQKRAFYAQKSPFSVKNIKNSIHLN
jgi:hypothetical protein